MARPGRPERNRAARSCRQLRRFRHVINSDKVFATHRRRILEWAVVHHPPRLYHRPVADRACRSRRVLTAAPDCRRDGAKRVRRRQANIAAGHGARSRQRLGNDHRIRIYDLSTLRGIQPKTCFRRSSRNNRLLAKLASIFPNHALLANFVLVDVAEGAPICLSKACTTSAFLSKIWTAQKRSTSEFLASHPANKSQTGFSLGIIFRFT